MLREQRSPNERSLSVEEVMPTIAQLMHTIPEALHVVADLAVNAKEDRSRKRQNLPPASPAGRRRAFWADPGGAIDFAFDIGEFLKPVHLHDLPTALQECSVMKHSQAAELVNANVRVAEETSRRPRLLQRFRVPRSSQLHAARISRVPRRFTMAMSS